MNEYVTWEAMGTLAGAVAAVLLIAQYTKSWVHKIDTRLYVLVLAVVITQLTGLVLGYSWQEHLITIFNGFIVAASAYGTYDVTFKATDEVKKASTNIL
jgi:hypothetical protein